MNLTGIRKEYQKHTLSKKDMLSDPILQFSKWFNEAVKSEIEMVNAMTLATSTSDGIPSARIVLLKEFDKRGFVFFTHFKSRKGHELLQNPRAALVFFWKELERQVRIEGMIEKLNSIDSDRYFKIRPNESKVSAIISEQSAVVPHREFLEDLWKKQMIKANNKKLIRPKNWGGFLLKPNQIEFWQGRPNRLNDRIVYKKEIKDWVLSRLAP